jgi:hypothetical protein
MSLSLLQSKNMYGFNMSSLNVSGFRHFFFFFYFGLSMRLKPAIG